MKSSLTILLVLLLSSSNSFAQVTGTWRHFTNSNGVNCMVPDGRYLWLGTDGGLVKYDRTVDTFVVLTPWNSGLPALQVSGMFRDKEGGIWIRAFNSAWVRLLNGVWKPTNVPIGVSVVCADSAGRVWMGGGGGLAKLDNGTWTIYTDSTSPLSGNLILSLSADRSGNVWILTDNQHDTLHASLLKTDGDTYWEGHNIQSDHSFDTTAGLGSVFAARDGSIWLRTGDKYSSILYHVHASIWDTITIQPKGGMFNSVTGMAEDATGLWICDENGAGHFDGKNWTVLDSTTGFPFSWPRNMIAEEGEVWFVAPLGVPDGTGITSPAGLARYSGGKWKRYDSLSNCALRGDNIGAMTVDNVGRYWFGEANGTRLSSFDEAKWTGFDSLTADGISANTFNALAADSSGNVWMSLAAGAGLVKFNGTSHQRFDIDTLVPHPDTIPPFSHFSYALACEKNGTLWVGTSPPGWSGLAKFDGKTWTPYQMVNSPIPDINISSIAIDHQGNIWIATSFGGIARFDGVSDWKIFNASNSAIPSDRVWKVVVAPNGDVWIATQGGAAKWDGTAWTSYAGQNPIAPSDLATVDADSHGNIWFGSVSSHVAGGVSMFDGSKWTMFSTVNSQVGSNTIRDIMPGKNGEMWIGTYDAGVVEYIPSTTSSVSRNSTATGSNILCYPNPLSAHCLIKFSSVTPNAVLHLTDLLGHEVRHIWQGTNGEHRIEFSAKGLAAGHYQISLLDGENSSSMPIEVRK